MQKYQVLARKYRPQSFREVVGQEVVVTTLKNAIRLGKVAHAYLFCGSRGTGKTTLARLFAKALNCERISELQEPCNQCSSCLDIMAGQSLDVIEIDGASNRGIDDIRQINEMVGYVPSGGRYKIYIIDEVHMLTKEAFNALLKTLEEPPAQAKFFFATTEPHKILPTIISRCQRFDLGRISSTQIITKLEQIARDLSREIDVAALHKIGELSDGSLRDAESLFDQILCFQDGRITADAVRQVFGLVSEEHFFALDQAFSATKLVHAFTLVNALFESGKDLAHFMSQLIEHYRLIALAKTVGEEALPAPLADRYMQTSRIYTQQQSLYLLEYLITSEAGLQKSLSPRIFLENALLHVIRTKNRIPIEVLVRRLTELEGTISSQSKEAESSFSIAEEAKPKTAVIPLEIKSKIEIPFAETEPKVTTLPERKLKIDAQSSSADTTPKVYHPQNGLDLSNHEHGNIASILPTSDRLKMSHYDGPANSQNLAERGIVTPLETTPKIATPPETKPKMDAQVSPPEGPKKHQSHYDTLMRFAAVELEGSLKT